METAKLFFNGRSQAVRLPKDYRFPGEEVAIKKVGDIVLLYQKDAAWDSFLRSEPVSDDFGEAVLEARNNDYADVAREFL